MGLSRRALLRLGGAAVAGAATGPFVWTPARAQGFNWKRFPGTELFLLLTKHPWIDVLEKNIPEFESLSGMKVKWETAYLFIHWATNKQNAVRELMGGVGVGRSSPWDNAEVKVKPQMPVAWCEAYQASLKIGRQGLPEIVAVTEYRDIIGVAIQRAIEGAPAAQVLAQAQKDFQELLNRTEG